jgi:hypothetical protein
MGYSRTGIYNLESSIDPISSGSGLVKHNFRSYFDTSSFFQAVDNSTITSRSTRINGGGSSTILNVGANGIISFQASPSNTVPKMQYEIGSSTRVGNVREFYLPITTTSDATWTTVFSIGGVNEGTTFINAEIISIGSGRGFHHARRGFFGSTAIGAIQDITVQENLTNMAIDIFASGSNILVQVRGVAATTIHWSGKITVFYQGEGR